MISGILLMILIFFLVILLGVTTATKIKKVFIFINIQILLAVMTVQNLLNKQFKGVYKMSRYIKPSKYKIVIHSDNLEEIELFEDLITQGLNTIAPHRNFKGITIANNFQGYWS